MEITNKNTTPLILTSPKFKKIKDIQKIDSGAVKEEKEQKRNDLVYCVEIKNWRKFLSTKAKANALKNQIEKMKEDFGFLSKEEIVNQFGLMPGDKTSIPIMSSDNEQIGKATYSWREEKIISAGWELRIS